MTALATRMAPIRSATRPLTDGYSAAFLGAAGIAVAGALLAAALLRTPKADDVATVEEPEQTPIAA